MRALASLAAAAAVLIFSGAAPADDNFEDPVAYGGAAEGDPYAAADEDAADIAVLGDETLAELSPVAAEPRVALVLGVSNYVGAQSLANPGNDAQLISNELSALGFDVRLELDPDLRTVQEAVIDLKLRMMAAGPEAIGLFYFAGHGIQHHGVNYLVPSDASLESSEYLDVEAVSANWVLGVMEAADVAANFVMLDACRNDPFTRSWTSSTRSADDHGLAQMQPPRGSFIVFSTAPGAVAYDGEGIYSPFAEALVSQIDAPGVLAETMFRRVVTEVERITEGLQSPWIQYSFSGDFYFGGPPSETYEGALYGFGDIAELYWQEIAAADDIESYEQYLSLFPDGDHAAEATARIASLQTAVTAPAAAALTVSSVAIEASPADYEGACPASIGFNGVISTAGGPGLVSYRFLDSEGDATALQTLSVEEPGDIAVNHAWTVGEDDADLDGWMMLEVLEPVVMRASERADFSVSCVEPVTRTAPPAETTPSAPATPPTPTETAPPPPQVDAPARFVWRARRNPEFLAEVERDDPELAAAIRTALASADRAAQDAGPPEQIAPSDGAIFAVSPRRMTFTWAPVEGARVYGIEIDCYHCCAPDRWCADVGGDTVIDSRVRGTSYTHTFIGAQPGRWRVWARFAGGAQTPMSPWRTFAHTE